MLVTSACAAAHNTEKDASLGQDDSYPTVTLEGPELAQELSETASRKAPGDFRRLGVLWRGQSPRSFELSTSPDGNDWSRWLSPELRHTEVDEESSFVGEILVPGGEKARFYRIRGTRGQRPVLLRMEFFDRLLSADIEVGDGEAASDIGSTSSMLSLGSVEVNGRATWGARTTRCKTSLNPFRITFHHTVTPTVEKNAPSRLREIQKYHMDVRGWCDIAYHFLITHDGQIWEGRSLDLKGTHVGNANTGNIGIAFMGSYHKDHPNELQIDAAAALIGRLGERFNIDLDSKTVKGHQDFKSTECPGKFLYQRLPQIIDRAGNSGGAPPPPEPVPQDSATLVGKVFDAADASKTISGATVQIGQMTVTTDDRGDYLIDVSPGTYEITASAPGFQSATITRETIALITWGSIGLSRVADSGSAGVQGFVHRVGDPNDRVAGATVFLDNGRSTTTDSAGYFKFGDLVPGSYTVSVSGQGLEGRTDVSTSNGAMEWASIEAEKTAGPVSPPPVPSAAPSCTGVCGTSGAVPGSSPGCFCDSLCTLNNDCCDDFDSVCASESMETGSCSGSCGSLDSVPGSVPECYCDAGCKLLGRLLQ